MTMKRKNETSGGHLAMKMPRGATIAIGETHMIPQSPAIRSAISIPRDRTGGTQGKKKGNHRDPNAENRTKIERESATVAQNPRGSAKGLQIGAIENLGATAPNQKAEQSKERPNQMGNAKQSEHVRPQGKRTDAAGSKTKIEKKLGQQTIDTERCVPKIVELSERNVLLLQTSGENEGILHLLAILRQVGKSRKKIIEASQPSKAFTSGYTITTRGVTSAP